MVILAHSIVGSTVSWTIKRYCNCHFDILVSKSHAHRRSEDSTVSVRKNLLMPISQREKKMIQTYEYFGGGKNIFVGFPFTLSKSSISWNFLCIDYTLLCSFNYHWHLCIAGAMWSRVCARFISICLSLWCLYYRWNPKFSIFWQRNMAHTFTSQFQYQFWTWFVPYYKFIENENVIFNIVVLVVVLAMVLEVLNAVRPVPISILKIIHFKLQFIRWEKIKELFSMSSCVPWKRRGCGRRKSRHCCWRKRR